MIVIIAVEPMLPSAEVGFSIGFDSYWIFPSHFAYVTATTITAATTTTVFDKLAFVISV